MLDFDYTSTHEPAGDVLASAIHPHVKTNFAFKVINFAADNNAYRLVCNSGNAEGCKAHCKRQFPGPEKALAADECTKAVIEAYSGSFGGFACFPMNSMVTRRRDGRIPLAELQEGDEILVSTESGIMYDTVIGFLHYDPTVIAEFLSISFGTGNVVIHRDHLIQVVRGGDGHPRYVKASDVRKEDHVRAVWIDGSLSPVKVTKIELVSETGLCCPVTMGGTIIVDQVACSCYSAPSGFLAFTVGHGLCHASMAPLRLHYQLKTAKVSQGKPVAGLHPYAKLLMTVATGASFA